jgi:hypothetical protein
MSGIPEDCHHPHPDVEDPLRVGGRGMVSVPTSTNVTHLPGLSEMCVPVGILRPRSGFARRPPSLHTPYSACGTAYIVF